MNLPGAGIEGTVRLTYDRPIFWYIDLSFVGRVDISGQQCTHSDPSITLKCYAIDSSDWLPSIDAFDLITEHVEAFW